MAYDTKSLNIQIPRMGEGENLADAGFSATQFVYRSADPFATVIAAAYIDDAVDKGLRVNDYVLVIDDATPLAEWALVTVVDVSTNPNGDATLIAFN
jgi:hypothetical protein